MERGVEPKEADETWGKLGGELMPVPAVAPPEFAQVTLFEAIWLMQLRLWLQIAEIWLGPADKERQT